MTENQPAVTDERLAETGTAIYNLLLAARVDPTLRKWAQTANDGFEFLRAELATKDAENERLRVGFTELLECHATGGYIALDKDFHERMKCALNPEPAP